MARLKDMEISNLIGFYQTQVGLVDRIWWYFYSITFLVLGFTIGSEKTAVSYSEVIIICVGSVAFSLGSAVSLWNGQGDLCLFADQIRDKDPKFALKPLSRCKVTLFQGAIVVAVVISVYRIFVS